MRKIRWEEIVELKSKSENIWMRVSVKDHLKCRVDKRLTWNSDGSDIKRHTVRQHIRTHDDIYPSVKLQHCGFTFGFGGHNRSAPVIVLYSVFLFFIVVF